MATTIFTADATLDSRVDAFMDAYAVMSEEAQLRGFNDEQVTLSTFEPFASTERGMLWQSFISGPSGIAFGVAKVYVK